MTPKAEAVLAGVRVGGDAPVRIMAVINVSPESFYSGSVAGDEAALRDAAQRAVAEGADFIDVGAMSTAPYLQTRISAEEEMRRMDWALNIVAPVVNVPVSADTQRAAVAAAALAGGARIINDVSGFRADPAMADIAAQAEGVVLMAAQPDPPSTEPPLTLVRRLLGHSLELAATAGIPDEHIVLDPGIGFFTRESLPPETFNCIVLDRLAELMDLGRPLLVGVSRKSFIGKLTGRVEAADRLAGSLAAAAVAVYNGAAIIRAHDVATTRDAVRVAEGIRSSRTARPLISTS